MDAWRRFCEQFIEKHSKQFLEKHALKMEGFDPSAMMQRYSGGDAWSARLRELLLEARKLHEDLGEERCFSVPELYKGAVLLIGDGAPRNNERNLKLAPWLMVPFIPLNENQFSGIWLRRAAYRVFGSRVSYMNVRMLGDTKHTEPEVKLVRAFMEHSSPRAIIAVGRDARDQLEDCIWQGRREPDVKIWHPNYVKIRRKMIGLDRYVGIRSSNRVPDMSSPGPYLGPHGTHIPRALS